MLLLNAYSSLTQALFSVLLIVRVQLKKFLLSFSSVVLLSHLYCLLFYDLFCIVMQYNAMHYQIKETYEISSVG